MTSREKLLRRPTYWFDHEQNEIFRQFFSYMEKEKINQTELSKRLGISRSRVSQILNGDLNCTLKKLVELSLSIGIVPRINYSTIEDVLEEDVQFNNVKKQIEEKKSQILREINELSFNKVQEFTALTTSSGDGFLDKTFVYFREENIKYDPNISQKIIEEV
ncbi:MAG TPA: helix-turn-helix transcriptional regulator [Cytophaga sp.]|nr:helix-turn-helix transcriptional regulator [Cytophaga sp.]